MIKPYEATDPAAREAARLDEVQRFESDARPMSTVQILGQMSALIDRAMGEAGFYAPELAAIALKQSHGDSAEASAILRGHRAVIPRNYLSEILDTERMFVKRRISSAFREIPFGQLLGATRDYTQRLIDESIVGETHASIRSFLEQIDGLGAKMDTKGFPLTYPRVVDLLREQGLIRAVDEHESHELVDVTRQAIRYPAPRSAAQ